VVKWLRIAGIFLVNLVVAAFGPATIGAEIHIHAYDWANRVLIEDIRSAGIAFVLGFFVYYFWKTPSSKWVWVAGVVWFTQRAVAYWESQHYLRVLFHSGSALEKMSGYNYSEQSLYDWSVYTLTSLRTVFYSAGAFLCWYLFRRGWPGWKIFSRSPTPEPRVNSEPTSG
jgi:hypothetical protein